MKYDHDRFNDLHTKQTAVLDSKKEAIIDFSEDNPALLKVGMPRKQVPEQFNHIPVFVCGGMHQPVEE